VSIHNPAFTRYVRDGTLWVPETRGLGDRIASWAKRLGIRECNGCAKRREKLNRWFPGKPIYMGAPPILGLGMPTPFGALSAQGRVPTVNASGGGGNPANCCVSVPGQQCSGNILLADNFNDVSGFSEDCWASGSWKSPSEWVQDTTVTFEGTSSLKLIYNTCGSPPDCNGPGFEDATLQSDQTQIYVRWYERYQSGWIWSGNGQKILFYNVVNPEAPWHTKVSFGSSNVELDVQGGFSTFSSFSYATDTWYCLEVRVKRDSGSSDGEWQMWVDGVEKANVTGIPSVPNGGLFNHILISGYYNAGGSTPNGVPQQQFRWIDALVVSTQPIGCLA